MMDFDDKAITWDSDPTKRERALAVGAHRYRSVASILEKGLDRQPLTPQQAELALPDHANLRGPGYYH